MLTEPARGAIVAEGSGNTGTGWLVRRAALIYVAIAVVLTAVAALAVNLPDAHETLDFDGNEVVGRLVPLRLHVVPRDRRPRLLLHRGRAVVGRVLPRLPARRASAGAGDRQHAARADRRHLGRGPGDAHALRALVRAAPRLAGPRSSPSPASRSIRTVGSSTARAMPTRCSSRSRSARSCSSSTISRCWPGSPARARRRRARSVSRSPSACCCARSNDGAGCRRAGPTSRAASRPSSGSRPG